MNTKTKMRLSLVLVLALIFTTIHFALSAPARTCF